MKTTMGVVNGQGTILVEMMIAQEPTTIELVYENDTLDWASVNAGDSWNVWADARTFLAIFGAVGLADRDAWLKLVTWIRKRIENKEVN